MSAGEQSSAAARLGQDAAELAAEQARELYRALAAPLRRTGEGTALLAAAAVCGGLALVTAHQAALRAAEAVLPRPAAALALSGGYAAAAAGCALAARARFRRAADESDTAVGHAPATDA
jgi:hypothetical protein